MHEGSDVHRPLAEASPDAQAPAGDWGPSAEPTHAAGAEVLEDRALVERFLRTRGEDDFRALYRRHSPRLAQTILRFLRGDQAEAEEVLQTAWIRAVERLEQFRWESSLRSWLTGIALNCSREVIRRRMKSYSHDPIDLHEPAEPPKIHGQIHRVDLERAIRRLPDGYREVLVLHDIEGYTHVDIGRMLGIESGTSKSQLSRARRTMRALLHRAEADD